MTTNVSLPTPCRALTCQHPVVGNVNPLGMNPIIG
jgi:hypothetical protein